MITWRGNPFPVWPTQASAEVVAGIRIQVSLEKSSRAFDKWPESIGEALPVCPVSVHCSQQLEGLPVEGVALLFFARIGVVVLRLFAPGILRPKRSTVSPHGQPCSTRMSQIAWLSSPSSLKSHPENFDSANCSKPSFIAAPCQAGARIVRSTRNTNRLERLLTFPENSCSRHIASTAAREAHDWR